MDVMERKWLKKNKNGWLATGGVCSGRKYHSDNS